MSIEQKVESATKALSTTLRLIRFSFETNRFISYPQEVLFKKILDRNDLSDEEKENEIDIATAGILVAALSYHSSKYKDVKKKEDNLSPYLWHKNGYSKLAYYPIQYKKLCAISGINLSTEPKPDNESIFKDYECLALSIGTKVINGELPFDLKTLSDIFDKHKDAKNHINEVISPLHTNSAAENLSNDITALKEYVKSISDKRNKVPRHFFISSILSETGTQDAYKIDVIFYNALNTAANGNDTPENKKFVEGVEALKKATLASFRKGETNFGFGDCEIIAQSVSKLAEKVASNNVTKDDVNEFTQATQKYKTSHTLAIALDIVIGALMGMSVGAASGFAVGGVPGAIIGSVAGLVVGGGLNGVLNTMWYTKKEPLNKVSAAAAEMVPSLRV